MQALLELIKLMGKGIIAEALAHFTLGTLKRSLTKHDDRETTKHDDRETKRLGGCYRRR